MTDTLATTMRAVRISRDHTQADAAEASGVPPASWANWEAGRTPRPVVDPDDPSADMFRRLARYLELPDRELGRLAWAPWAAPEPPVETVRTSRPQQVVTAAAALLPDDQARTVLGTIVELFDADFVNDLYDMADRIPAALASHAAPTTPATRGTWQRVDRVDL